MSKSNTEAKSSSLEQDDQQNQGLDPEQRQQYIAEAAYYRALERGLSEGYEQDDWLAAEEDIKTLYPEPL